uniref:Uncharacterized protein n=1 Tax=Caulobacter sp. (strain K31) TaxID=366602 RepID=B0T1G9_CAUSK
MDAADLLPHRAALIGAAIALVVGLTGGLALQIGSQPAPEMDYAASGDPYGQVEPIAWPSGKVADYVIGTDFLRTQKPDQPPVVVASYEVPEYVPPTWTEPAPQVQPVRRVEAEDRAWASTQGDILDVRLPEDAPRPPEAPLAIEAPAAPVALAAAD